jgi:polar amino acid transport system substrate-binding protein
MQIEQVAASARNVSRAAAALGVLLVALGATSSAAAATLDRIKETGRIRFGYFTEVRPFTYKDSAGAVEGYGVSLCQRIADQVKSDLALSDLTVDWVPLSSSDRLAEIQQGDIDVLCTPTSVTLNRRREMSYSIPVFPGGARAVLRADAPTALREALAETPSLKPVWRGSPAAKTLRSTSVGAVSGTTTEVWLTGAVTAFQIGAKVVPVADFRSGLQQLREGKIDVFFGDRAAIAGAMEPSAHTEFVILDRLFTREQYALALPRGDEDFRLLVDRALSKLYATDIGGVYAKSFGPPDDAVRTFFKWNTLTQ